MNKALLEKLALNSVHSLRCHRQTDKQICQTYNDPISASEVNFKFSVSGNLIDNFIKK